MLNPIATEALFSATYVDNYIDSVENLPDDVQRYLSRIRDIDVQYRNHLRDVDHYYELWKSIKGSNETLSTRRARALARMQQNLIQAQELGDEKMQIVNQLQELIDLKTRQLDMDQKNLDIKEELQQQGRLDALQSEDGAPTPQKLSRMQSPSRGEQIMSNCGNSGSGKDHSFGTYGGNGSCGSGGGSTPNSERSGNNGNALAGQNGSGAGSGNSGNVGAGEMQRAVGKRSRRRNDTINNSQSDLGTESNAANDAVAMAGANERHSTHKSSNMSGSQKRNSTHNQSSSGSTAGGGGMSGGAHGGSSGKKKKRKARGGQSVQAAAREETPPPDPIDPDEPTYCVCNQISFGEMILCDNDLCPIEWFHFSCVSLVFKPKGKWYCPNCRGDRPNVMKPKAQFLKELERYNKEKEEKT